MEWRKIIETDDIVEVISRSDVKNVMCWLLWVVGMKKKLKDQISE